MHDRVLFVTEKWPDANPDLGWSNNFHNLFNSFSQCQPDYVWDTIHLDEAAIFNTHINEVLPVYCLRHNVKIIFISFLGHSTLNPSIETLKKLKKIGIYIAVHWPDSNPNDLIFRDSLRQAGVVDLNIIWDNPSSTLHDNLVRHPNDLYLWVPQDSHMFYYNYESTYKPIPVSFVGNPTFADRSPALQVLAKKFPKAFIGGGQRQQRLSPYEYAKVIRDSAICINFSGHPAGYHQVKGRVYEVLTTGGMLLESKNPATAKILKPGEHYIEFDGPDDLVAQVERFTQDTERVEIAGRGRKFLQENYSTEKFWQVITERIQRELH